MNKNKYKYDVAFSFLAEDEDLATQINDLIQDRVNTFLYSRKQDAIAGTDGEKTFNRVFGSEAGTLSNSKNIAGVCLKFKRIAN